MNRIVYYLAILLIAAGCSNMGNQAGRVPVAKAGDAILYADELPAQLFSGVSGADSTALVQSYIGRWAKRELLYQKANENLGYEIRREIEMQVNETRANLVIYQYQRQMMEEKMDTLLNDSDLEEYYELNQESFSLRSNIVKAMFIKIPLDVQDRDRIEELTRADNPEQVSELETLCYYNAVKYDDFNEEWIAFDRLSLELPENIQNEEAFLRRTGFYVAEDSLFTYFVKFRDYKLRSTVAPYEYVKSDIERIFLNNRRVNFIQSLENDIYNEAVSKNTFTLF